MERIFGKDSREIKEIEKIRLESIFHSSVPITYNTETVRETGSSIINACIYELELLGSPNQINNGEKQGINLIVNQSQKNEQTIKLDIIFKELRNELTCSQLDEIQKILNSTNKTENKKNKTIEKLKEFGIDALSNIITGILTNPSMIG